MPERRRDDRDDHEHGHHQRHDARHPATDVEVADDGDGDDPATGGAHALGKAHGQKELEVGREHACDAGQRVADEGHEEHRAAADAIGDGSEDDLRGAEAQHVSHHDELLVVRVQHPEITRDLAEGRQHQVDRERVEGHQRGHHRDQLGGAERLRGQHGERFRHPDAVLGRRARARQSWAKSERV